MSPTLAIYNDGIRVIPCESTADMSGSTSQMNITHSNMGVSSLKSSRSISQKGSTNSSLESPIVSSQEAPIIPHQEVPNNANKEVPSSANQEVLRYSEL